LSNTVGTLTPEEGSGNDEGYSSISSRLLLSNTVGTLTQEEGSGNDDSVGSSHRTALHKKLDAALSKQQEAEARAITLSEKLKQVESERDAMKSQVH